MTSPSAKSPTAAHYLSRLGQKIRQRRRALGLGQREAAEACGIDYRHFQKIEAGAVNVRVQTLFDVASRLGMPICLLSCPVVADSHLGASCEGCEFSSTPPAASIG